jgi:hypothetical protein
MFFAKKSFRGKLELDIGEASNVKKGFNQLVRVVVLNERVTVEWYLSEI